jgi:hypothetical protein
VVPRLKEVDAVVADEVDDAVLFGEAARPDSRAEVLQGFRLPKTLERVAQNRRFVSTQNLRSSRNSF